MILGDQPIGEVIAQQRINLGMSIVDVARLAGITGSAISKIEKGDRNPTWDVAVAIFNALGISLELTFCKPEPDQRKLFETPAPRFTTNPNPPEFFVVPAPRKPDHRIHGDA